MSQKRVAGIAALVLLAGVLGWLALGPGDESDSDAELETVQVVVAYPSGQPIGAAMVNAVQLALDESGGRAGNRRVELIHYDTDQPEQPGNPEMRAIQETQIATNENIVAYLGATSSGNAVDVIPTLNRLSVAVISPSATWPGLTRPGYGEGEPGIYYPSGQRNFFRVVPSDDIQGLVAGQWMREQGIFTIYLVSMPNPYSDGLVGILEANARDFDLTVAGRSSFDGENLSEEDALARAEEIAAEIMAVTPDALYFPFIAGGRGIILLEAVRRAAPDLLIMSGDGLVGGQLPEDTSLLEGVYGTNTTLEIEQIPSATDFLTRYEERFGEVPPSFALPAYESMRVLLRAIENADSPTREAVLAALRDLGEVSGAMGVWSFDGAGDTSLRAISVMRFQDGMWETVKVYP